MNQAIATSPSPPPAAVIPHDFPDRLSPIVVKELRQGLRQPSFVIAFLCLQVILCIVVLVAAASGAAGSRAGSEVGSVVSSFFFVLLGIVLLAVQPLRGLNALSAEIKTDTLDLLLLTRLNGWWITYGKWLALVTQSGLLVVAVLPYLVLRYYLGGMRLFPELLSLGYMLLVSGSLTAMTVGFSANTSLVLRGLVGAGLVVFLFTIMQGVGMYFLVGRHGGMGMFAPSSGDEWQALALIALMFVFYGGYLLAMGATSIAPEAENRTTFKRLAGLGVLALVLLLTEVDNPGRSVCWLLVSGLLIVDALSERPGITASVLRPFRRWKVTGLMWPLLPGWPSGVLYAGGLMALSLVLAFAGVLYDAPTRTFTDSFTAMVPLWSALLLVPAGVRVLLLQKVRNPLAGYVAALAGSLVVGIVVSIIAQATDMTEALYLALPISPMCGMVALAKESEHAYSIGAYALAVACGWWVILFIKSLPFLRRVRDLGVVREHTPPP